MIANAFSLRTFTATSTADSHQTHKHMENIVKHPITARVARLFAVIATTALVAGGCALAGSDENDGAIKIGAVLSLSGPAAPFGVPERDAAQAYIDDVNEDGGVDGQEIEFIVKDDKTNPTEAAQVAQDLVDEGVVAIIGSTTGSATQAMSAVTAPAEVPVIALNTTMGITGDWVFLASVGDEHLVPAIFDRMVDQGHRKLAVFHQEDALGQYGAELFSKLADKSPGVEIVATTSAPLDASDLSPQAVRLRNAKPDAVFVAVSATGLAAGFLRAADGVGLDLPHFGGMSLAQDAIIEAAGEKAAEGFTVANMIDGTNLLDNQTGLYEMLKKHDVNPVGGFPDIGGAGAASMIIAGLREAGPDSKGPEIVKAWETGMEMETFTKVPGAYGPNRRHAHTTDVLIWTTVRDGAFTGAD